jgi:hypothetical protein
LLSTTNHSLLYFSRIEPLQVEFSTHFLGLLPPWRYFTCKELVFSLPWCAVNLYLALFASLLVGSPSPPMTTRRKLCRWTREKWPRWSLTIFPVQSLISSSQDLPPRILRNPCRQQAFSEVWKQFVWEEVAKR